MKKYVLSLTEYYSSYSRDKFVPYLSGDAVSGLEYQNQDELTDASFRTKTNNLITVSKRFDKTLIMPDGSFFRFDYQYPKVETEIKYNHYFVYPDSKDLQTSIDKFRLYDEDLKEIYKDKLKRTLIYTDTSKKEYAILDRDGNILER